MSEATENSEQRKWWARALLVGGVIALVALPLGALGTKFGVWTFQGGFLLLAVGVVLATIVFFLGIVGGVYAHVKKRGPDRNDCLIGAVIGVVILGVMGSNAMTAFSVPPIHNISTDTSNPPQFDQLATLRETLRAENPDMINALAYDTENLPQQQQAAYPQVKPLISSTAPDEMLERAASVVEDLGMELVQANRQRGIVEATDTTFWFGFKDDVVIRVRAEGAGSVVDIRSVSRVGQSDLGKNAERIMAILGALAD